MATQIDANIRLRRGPDAERQTIVLSGGEISFSTDIKRVFIGDGATVGGSLVGNQNFVTTIPSASAVRNDLLYLSNTNVLYVLTGTGGGDNLANYARITPNFGSALTYSNGTLNINTTYFNNTSSGFVKLSGDSVLVGSLSVQNITSVNTMVLQTGLDMKSNAISNVGYPSLYNDAATKSYVDTLSSSLVALIYSLSSQLLALSSASNTDYVKKTGDTMTGQLTIQSTLSVTGNITTNSDVIAFA